MKVMKLSVLRNIEEIKNKNIKKRIRKNLHFLHLWSDTRKSRRHERNEGINKMTKENLIEMVELLNDDEVQDVIDELHDRYEGMLLGNVYKTRSVYDRKTGKTRTEYERRSFMELLESISDALWTIADRM